MRGTVRIWKGRGPRPYWWHFTHRGQILADGAQSYSRRIDALAGARRVTGTDLAPQPDRRWRDEGGRTISEWDVA